MTGDKRAVQAGISWQCSRTEDLGQSRGPRRARLSRGPAHCADVATISRRCITYLFLVFATPTAIDRISHRSPQRCLIGRFVFCDRTRREGVAVQHLARESENNTLSAIDVMSDPRPREGRSVQLIGQFGLRAQSGCQRCRRRLGRIGLDAHVNRAVAQRTAAHGPNILSKNTQPRCRSCRCRSRCRQQHRSHSCDRHQQRGTNLKMRFAPPPVASGSQPSWLASSLITLSGAQDVFNPCGAVNLPSSMPSTKLQFTRVGLPSVYVKGGVSPPRVSPFIA